MTDDDISTGRQGIFIIILVLGALYNIIICNKGILVMIALRVLFGGFQIFFFFKFWGSSLDTGTPHDRWFSNMILLCTTDLKEPPPK